MRNKVQEFIELWKDKRSLKTLMTSDITASETEELRSELMKMDQAQQKEAKKALKDVSNMLVKRIGKLMEKRETLHKEIERSKKTKKACLAYQKQGQLSPTHKEERAENTAHKIARVQEREKRLRENLKTIEKNNEDDSGK
ncbi:MAG: hypothetical protein KAJ29_03245 [Alphaproteobacteria bacterium]|nr:hypothetical protein [Alphaproteobacteria bacterium]